MSLAAAILASLALPPLPARSGTTTSGVRPDAWIRLCGARNGCTDHAIAPTPYKGNDIYNGTGLHQTASGKMEEGNYIFFWITFQNDGSQSDTFLVKGCAGNPVFEVRQYAIGAWTRRRYYKPIIITPAVKNGTASFPLPQGGKVAITLDVEETVANIPGRIFTCPITVRSKSDPSIRDTVVAKMIIY
jgi:hypothetical protein